MIIKKTCANQTHERQFEIRPIHQALRELYKRRKCLKSDSVSTRCHKLNERLHPFSPIRKRKQKSQLTLDKHLAWAAMFQLRWRERGCVRSPDKTGQEN